MSGGGGTRARGEQVTVKDAHRAQAGKRSRGWKIPIASRCLVQLVFVTACVA